jgi:primosomal replication protein N
MPNRASFVGISDAQVNLLGDPSESEAGQNRQVWSPLPARAVEGELVSARQRASKSVLEEKSKSAKK